jgi:hypothetical protein
MPEDGTTIPINELRKKIEFFYKDARGRTISGFKGLAPFCDALKFPRATLQSNLENGDALNPNIDRKIRDHFRIREGTALFNTWRTGIAEEFIEAILARHMQASTERQAPDFEIVRDRENWPQSVSEALASTYLSVPQQGREDPVSVSIDLSCPLTDEVTEIPIGVRRGFLSLHCTNAETHSFEIRKQIAAKLSNDDLTITAEGPIAFQPYWIVEANKGAIGTLSLPHDFCELQNLILPVTLILSFSVHLKEIETPGPRQINPPTSKFAALWYDAQEHNDINKQRILERVNLLTLERKCDKALRAKKIPDPKLPNRKILCADWVELHPAEST